MAIKFSIMPIFQAGNIVLPIRIDVTHTKDGTAYKGNLTPDELFGPEGAGLRKALGIKDDQLFDNIFDLLIAAGADIDESVKEFINLDIEEISFAYFASSDGKNSIFRLVADFSLIAFELVYVGRGGEKGITAFGATLSSEISLAKLLPLVDPKTLPKFSLGLQLVYAGGEISRSDLSEVKKQLTFLLEENDTIDDSFIGSMTSLKKGLAVAPKIAIDDLVILLDIPIPAQGESDSKKKKDKKRVDKPLGPLSFGNIGIDFEDGNLIFEFDATLNLKILTASLLGLQLKFKLQEILKGDFSNIKFDLKGVFLSLKKGKVTISGGLLKFQMPNPDGTMRDEYAGKIKISVPKFTITALCAYSQLPDGQHSIFAYVALLIPMGGIPEFFIEGVALGFGYNRGLEKPPIEEIVDFPLVAALQKSPGSDTDSDIDESAIEDLRKEFEALGKYFPAQSGQYVLAVGLNFSTYKMVSTIALLLVEFGKREFELHLVGIATLALPPSTTPADPIAQIELALMVSIMPDKGIVSVEAQLTKNSFILSEDCRLTGGFAFYYWFGRHPNAGEFLITLGGYHPRFKKPDNYPSVPRVGFNWQIADILSAKGGMYFALTPVAIMAGGGFEFSLDIKIAAAWAKAGLDFIIYWDPIYYEVSAYVEFGARILFVSFETGVNLAIKGPEFSVQAKLWFGDLAVTIDIGDAKPKANPIKWEKFTKKYLMEQVEKESNDSDAPDDKDDIFSLEDKNDDTAEYKYIELVTVQIISGSKYEVKNNDVVYYVVDPDKFELEISSQMPINMIKLNGENKLVEDTFHIAPMGGQDAPVQNWSMNVTADIPEGIEFIYTGVKKSLPLALWGDKMKADIESDDRTISLLSGAILTGNPGKEPLSTELVRADDFKFQDVVENDPYWQWGKDLTLFSLANDAIVIVDTLNETNTAILREEINTYFHRYIDISLDKMGKSLSSAFIGIPQAFKGV